MPPVETTAKELNIVQVLKNLGVAVVEKNSDEVIHTGNTGKGKELVPLNVLSAQIAELFPTYSRLLPLLPSNHGSGLAVTQKVPVLGAAPLFDGDTQWEDQAGVVGPDAPNKTITTGEVTITQATYRASMAVSDQELAHAITGALELQNRIVEKLAEGAARTIDAVILNGDTTATSSGNVNKDDGTPASTAYYLNNDNGIRKLGLSDADHYVNVGTLEFADLLSMRGQMGGLASRASDLLWVTNVQTENSLLGLAEFKNAYQSGVASTAVTGNLVKPLGIDYLCHEDFGLTEADGKISGTAANNTKGGIALIHKPSIQYGYGMPLKIEVVRVAGRGVLIVATFEFGFTIADMKAGVTDPSVVLGYNITL